jgi:hypothetical protein
VEIRRLLRSLPREISQAIVRRRRDLLNHRHAMIVRRPHSRTTVRNPPNRNRISLDRINLNPIRRSRTGRR